jgi:hypothetical protein
MQSFFFLFSASCTCMLWKVNNLEKEKMTKQNYGIKGELQVFLIIY